MLEGVRELRRDLGLIEIVLGVGVSADMLRRAWGRGIETVHADVTALPFDEESFDAVVSLK